MIRLIVTRNKPSISGQHYSYNLICYKNYDLICYNNYEFTFLLLRTDTIGAIPQMSTPDSNAQNIII